MAIRRRGYIWQSKVLYENDPDHDNHHHYDARLPHVKLWDATFAYTWTIIRLYEILANCDSINHWPIGKLCLSQCPFQNPGPTIFLPDLVKDLLCVAPQPFQGGSCSRGVTRVRTWFNWRKIGPMCLRCSARQDFSWKIQSHTFLSLSPVYIDNVGSLCFQDLVSHNQRN